MSGVINGKKPIQSKPSQKQYDVEFPDDPFANPLALPENFKKQFTDNGLEIRFVNLKKVQQLGGFHERGWVPFTKTKFSNIELPEFHWGSSPDGKIIRGDLVLACRPISLGDKHRAHLRARANRLDMNQKKNAAELRKMAGGKARVLEGYDDDK